jgi:circadian clock protein KaiC
MSNTVTIRRLATGVPGLDAVLGGGLPEFSFNVISGPPGAGKTTLAHQVMFSLATPENPALYFTVFGEPPLKMLRYQQQFSFFDSDKVGKAIRFVDLGDDMAAGSFDQVLARVAAEVKASGATLVFVDSFHSFLVSARTQLQGATNLQYFIQRLGSQLSSWQATTFLISGHLSEMDGQPIHTMADGLLELSQSTDRNSMVRKMTVVKVRGQETSPGAHTFRITRDGVEVFPAALVFANTQAAQETLAAPEKRARLPMGVLRLDEMLGGGLPSGYSLLVAGPSGSGKTVLATAFLAEGVRNGEAGVMVAFEQTPSYAWDLTIADMVRAGGIGLINTRSLDLSVAEIVQRLLQVIHDMKATRVVIDSLSGFELAVAPTFRQDFRESLFRMITALAGRGVTVLMTSEIEDRYSDLRFSPYGSAFLTDAIIVQRYLEVQSRLKRVMAVVKVRDSDHCKELREFEITDRGIVIGDPILAYEGLLGGRPTRATAPHPDGM